MSGQKADLCILSDLCISTFDYRFTARAEPNPAVKLRSLLDKVVIRMVLGSRCAYSVIDVDRRSRFEIRCWRRGGLRSSRVSDMRVV